MPDTELYPEFDENLRDAMQQETRLFVGGQVRTNRSVTELLTADYSMLNQRLATHYGLRNVYGRSFPSRRPSPTARAAVCSATRAC